MRATFHPLLATFALLSLPAAPRARGDTGLPVTAIFGGSQRTASALRGHNDNTPPDVNSSSACKGLPTAQMASIHGEPHAHATAATQPERDPEPTQPDITHAARAHNRPQHLSPLAGHTQHAEAPPRPTLPHSSTNVLATLSQSDGSIERSYKHGRSRPLSAPIEPI